MAAKASQGNYGVPRGYRPTPRVQGERQEFELAESDYQDLVQACAMQADFEVWQKLAERDGFAAITVRWQGPGTRFFTAKVP